MFRPDIEGVINMQIINNQEGIAIIFVLLLITFMGLGISIILNSTELSIKLSNNIAGYKKAYYAAEAGIQYGKYLIESNDPGFPFNLEDYQEGDQFGDEINLENNSKFSLFFYKKNVEEIVIIAKGCYNKYIKEIKINFYAK